MRSNLIEPNSPPCPPLPSLFFIITARVVDERATGGGKTRATSVEHVWNARYARRYARWMRAENVLFVPPPPLPCYSQVDPHRIADSRLRKLVKPSRITSASWKIYSLYKPITDRKRVTNQRNLHFPYQPRGISRGFPLLHSHSLSPSICLNSSVAILVFTIQPTLRYYYTSKKQFSRRNDIYIYIYTLDVLPWILSSDGRNENARRIIIFPSKLTARISGERGRSVRALATRARFCGGGKGFPSREKEIVSGREKPRA